MGDFSSFAETFLVALIELEHRGKCMFMARIRAGIISLPGEGILPININGVLNRTITFFF